MQALAQRRFCPQIPLFLWPESLRWKKLSPIIIFAIGKLGSSQIPEFLPGNKAPIDTLNDILKTSHSGPS